MKSSERKFTQFVWQIDIAYDYSTKNIFKPNCHRLKKNFFLKESLNYLFII